MPPEDITPATIPALATRTHAPDDPAWLAGLRALFLFETFSDEQLRWLVAHSEEVTIPGGTHFLREGHPVDALWVLLEGEMRLYRFVAGQEVVIETTSQPGAWAGWLPMFEDLSLIGGRVLRPSRLLRIPKEAARHMLDGGFPIATHLLIGVSWGVQTFESATRQQEKLAAIGQLSAGLAHELNNPASAARRAADQLLETLRTRDARALALGRLLDPAAADDLAGFVQIAVARAESAPLLDPLARGDREEALAAWLDARAIPDAWDLAPPLAEAGLTPADLDTGAAKLDPAALPDALAWIASSVTVTGLARAIAESDARISTLVGAIRDYSYLDQAPQQDIDLRAGLDSTLAVLAHRLDGIAIERDYAPDLPIIRAHGGQLNQVWTHLLDNAAAALAALPPGQRRIAIRATPDPDNDGGGVLVEIADNGPGIPPEIQGRVFDPFFTTKPVGQGAGLGLDSSYRIVVGQHGGSLRVVSVPGDTRLQVRLPLEPPRSSNPA